MKPFCLWHFLFLIVLLNIASSCKDNSASNNSIDLIPVPLKSTISDGFSKISTLTISDESAAILGPLVNWINDWPIDTKSTNPGNFNLEKNDSLDDGAYRLTINEHNILIQYKEASGLSSALSSIYQLLKLNASKLPILEIEDKAKFSYRGMHLDVARHMFNIEEIKQYVDYLSIYKFNKFHWHITDDQGWRIEIKKYPKLQETAAYRPETLIGHYSDQPHKFDGKRYGGYYSQEEIKEVINYATARGIEVIPEIDIPGHTTAVIAAYPELSCHGKQIHTATKWGVFFDVLCPTEETFHFLENVFDEIIDLFPSKYIHIGGDECPKQQWKESAFCQNLMKEKGLKDEYELQSYFIKRIEKYINAKGKQIIGWDEILEGGIAPNATIMSWRGFEGGIEAAKAGHDVIMTPTSHCYFDYYQSEASDEPLAIGGYTPFQKVYDFSPIPKELNQAESSHILGGQGNLWTEYLKSFEDIEYMLLTRMITLSEVLWGKNSHDIDAFTERLFDHTTFWISQGANMANHLIDVYSSSSVDQNSGVKLKLRAPLNVASIYAKGPADEDFHELSEPELQLRQTGDYEFYATLEDHTGRHHKIKFEAHKGNKASIELVEDPADKYSGNGPASVINGICGPDDRYGGSEWLGFSGKDFDATIEFDTSQEINTIDLRFFKGEGQWIYLPKAVKIIDLENENQLLYEMPQIQSETKLANISIELPEIQSQKLRIIVENFGIIPDGRQGAGNPSWLFIDEIKIK